MNCSQCGHTLEPTMKFCPKCGTAQNGNSDIVAKPDLVQNTQQEKLNISPQKSKKKIVNSLIGTVLILFFAFGGYSCFRQDSSINTIKASELADAYSQDSQTADAKYKGKTLKLNGIVEYKGQFNNTNNIFVCIYDKNDVNVLLQFTLDQKDKVNQLKEGDIITATGYCKGTIPQKNADIISIQLENVTINK